MVKINCLSSGTDDCFLVEIKYDDDTKLRLLVDGGKNTENLIKYLKRIKGKEYFTIDYIIVTHIDSDHIKGIIDLYVSNDFDKNIGNAKLIYNYIVDCPEISYTQAEKLEKIVRHKQVMVTYKNGYKLYNNDKIMFLSYEDRKNEEYCYNEIKKKKVILTFLNPTYEMVLNVHKNYTMHRRDAECVNKSSIVFLLEYKDKVMLFTGDCFLCDVIDKISNIYDNTGNASNAKIDFIKVPHHGAYPNNKEIKDLIEKYKCDKIFVTCGEKDKKHPSKDFLESIKGMDKLNLYSNNIGNSNYDILKCGTDSYKKKPEPKLQQEDGIVI